MNNHAAAASASAASPSQPVLVLKPSPVPGNGDCLFYSVARILLDWLDRVQQREELDRELDRELDTELERELGAEMDLESPSTSAPLPPPPPPPPTAKELDEVARYLRGRVAMRVLDPEDAACNETLATWWQLWRNGCKEKDIEIMMEMQHMKGVTGPPEQGVTGPPEQGVKTNSPSPPRFPLADRRIVFRNMMDPRIYWGDEFALRTMEAVLGCRLCVVNERYHVVQREHGGREVGRGSPSSLPEGALPDNDVPFLGLLLLVNSHYEPLAGPGSTFSWDMRSLPVPLRRLVAQWLSEEERGFGEPG